MDATSSWLPQGHTDRPAAAGTAVSQPIADLPLFVWRAQFLFLHEITPLLLWDYLPPGAKQQLKTMQMGDIEPLCRQIDLKKGRASQDRFGNYQLFFFFLSTAVDFISLGRARWRRKFMWRGIHDFSKCPPPKWVWFVSAAQEIFLQPHESGPIPCITKHPCWCGQVKGRISDSIDVVSCKK